MYTLNCIYDIHAMYVLSNVAKSMLYKSMAGMIWSTCGFFINVQKQKRSKQKMYGAV